MFGLIVGALSVVSLAVSVIDIGISVCKSLGIIKKDMPPEELGDRALQAQEKGVKLEDYAGRYDEYIKDIESLELEPEVSEKFSLEEKNKAAAQVLGAGLVEHYGKESGVENFIGTELVEANKDFYNPARVVSFMNTFKNSGIDMGNINKYFDSKLDSMQEIRYVNAKLVEAEKKLGINEEQAKKNLNEEQAKRSENL